MKIAAEFTEYTMPYGSEYERIKTSPPKDFTHPDNQQEKKRLLNTMFLKQVETKLLDLRNALQYEFINFGDEVPMDLTKAKAEAALARSNPLQFLADYVRTIVTSLDIDAMFTQGAVSKEEAAELVALALSNQGISIKSFPTNTEPEVRIQ